MDSSTPQSSAYQSIMNQIAALEGEAAIVRQREREEALQQVLTLVDAFNLTPEEIRARKVGIEQSKSHAKRARGGKAIKYRDPVSGKTWSGKGKRPSWIVAALNGGSSLDSFKAG